MAMFQTFRQDGALQFDAGLMTMALIGKGSVASQARVSGTSTPSSILIPLPDLSTPIIIAVQCPVVAARCGRYVSNGQPVAHLACAGPVGTALRYWLFGQSNRFPPTGVGLELYDSSGNLTYSSARPVCNVAAILPGEGQSVTLADGRQYAVATQEFTGRDTNNGRIYKDGVAWEPGDGGNTASSSWSFQNDGKLFGSSVNGGTIVTGNVSYNDGRKGTGTGRTPIYPPASAKWYRAMGAALVVDVTGH